MCVTMLFPSTSSARLHKDTHASLRLHNVWNVLITRSVACLDHTDTLQSSHFCVFHSLKVAGSSLSNCFHGTTHKLLHHDPP